MSHWRDTYKPARFFFLDARAGIPVLATLLHVRPWTVGLTALVVIFFWAFERRGLSFFSALRALRSWAIGDRRPALGKYKERGMIDYGRNDF